MSGVSCFARNGVNYWYARIEGGKKNFGKDEKGREMAEAAKQKANVKQYENREANAVLKTKKAEFKTVMDLCNWFMELPTIQEQKT